MTQKYLRRKVTKTDFSPLLPALNFVLSLKEYFSLILQGTELIYRKQGGREEIIQDSEYEENIFLLSSDRFWKSHALGIDARRPKGELLHWDLHGPLLTRLLTAERFLLTARAIIAAGSPWPALGAAINNPQEGKFCYQKLETALLETPFFLRGLPSFNRISGFAEHFTDFRVILARGPY